MATLRPQKLGVWFESPCGRSGESVWLMFAGCTVCGPRCRDLSQALCPFPTPFSQCSRLACGQFCFFFY